MQRVRRESKLPACRRSCSTTLSRDSGTLAERVLTRIELEGANPLAPLSDFALRPVRGFPEHRAGVRVAWPDVPVQATTDLDKQQPLRWEEPCIDLVVRIV